MRTLSFLLIGAALAACAPVTPPGPNPQAQAKLQRLLAGKVAGQSMMCIPSYRADKMITIDDNTIAFRDGNRVYVNEMQGGGCSRLSSGFYTLVTRSTTTSLCRGDIAELADPASGMMVGSCVFGDFVPYSRT